GCLRLRYSSGARPRLASSKRATTYKKKGTKKHEPKQPQSGWTRCTSGEFCRSDSGGKRSVAGAGIKHFVAGGPAAFGKMGAASHERECLPGPGIQRHRFCRGRTAGQVEKKGADPGQSPGRQSGPEL